MDRSGSQLDTNQLQGTDHFCKFSTVAGYGLFIITTPSPPLFTISPIYLCSCSLYICKRVMKIRITVVYKRLIYSQRTSLETKKKKKALEIQIFR